MPEYEVQARIRSLDPMVTAYLECAEWCGMPEGDLDYGVPNPEGLEGFRAAVDADKDVRWSLEAERKAAADCRAFMRDVSDCRKANPEAGWDVHPSTLGHNLWLTRNRHGAGFWDSPNEFPKGFATFATDHAHYMGECSVWFNPSRNVLHLD